ncbi:MAG: STAS domain-containing protein, partial [Clostridia bacterium]|nr:STAS domain-containing protein [Clostridia bacterium]
MDSAGLGVILGRFRKLSMRGGKLVVKGMNASVDRIFQMSGLYAIVERQ